MADICDFAVPGQYEWDGMMMTELLFPSSVLKRVASFQFRPTDILIATYPKCGTTWMQEIAFLVSEGGDITKANEKPLYERVPFLEKHVRNVCDMDILEKHEEPRLIKTHLQSKFFEHNLASVPLKVIVVCRNPKDCLVSYYNFYKSHNAYGPFTGSWDQYFSLVRDKKLIHGDYGDFYSGWRSEALKYPERIMFVYYEEMKTSHRKAICKVANFLSKPLQDTQVDSIEQFTKFEAMRENPMCRVIPHCTHPVTFFRKGVIGDWQKYFTPDQSDYMDHLWQVAMPH